MNTVDSVRAATSTSASREANPFVPINLTGRLMLILFVVFYRLIVPGLQEILSPSITPMAGLRLIAEWVNVILVLAPVVFYRPQWGWLHPLLFPLAWSVATTLARTPEFLLAPLALTEPRETFLYNQALVGWTQGAIAAAELRATLLQILATSLYYLGFFVGPRLPVPRIPFADVYKPRAVATKMLLVLLVAAATTILVVASRGGIVQHIYSLGRGRFETLEGLGPALVLAQTGGVAMLLWYALGRAPTANPLFWLGIGFAIPVNFVLTGSRSALAFSVVLFLMVWMLKHRRLPAARSLLLAAAFFLLFGALGELRNSARRGGGTLEMSTLVEFDVERMVELSRAEMTSRPSGFVAVVGRGSEVGFLWGKTYLNLLMFWVPRAVWEDKPRGAGAYAGTLLFGSGGGGVPPGPVGEAYWNFHVPGVVLIFFLYGMFHRMLAQALRTYGSVPAVWPLYAIILVFVNPHTIEFVNGIQMLVPAVVLLVWLGVLRPFGRRGKTVSPVGATTGI